MRKLFRVSFLLLIAAIIVYPAYYLYQNPQLLATPTQIASSEPTETLAVITETPLLATQEPIASSEPAPAACLIVRSLPGGEGNLNLRAGAGTSFPVLAVLRDGQTLTEDGQSGEWYAVTAVVDGQELSGYVHSDYVEDCE